MNNEEEFIEEVKEAIDEPTSNNRHNRLTE